MSTDRVIANVPVTEADYYDNNLLSPEALEAAAEVAQSPLLFNEKHTLVAGNANVLLIGSSPTKPIWFPEGSVQTWTQLPRSQRPVEVPEGIPVDMPDGRIIREGVLNDMNIQFTWAIPGMVLYEDGSARINISRLESDPARLVQIEDDFGAVTSGRLLPEQLDTVLQKYAAPEAYLGGFYTLLRSPLAAKAAALKGHHTGLYTFGIKTTDQTLKPIIYSDYFDVISHAYLLAARWQLKEMQKVNSNALIFLDEPSIVAGGQALLVASKPEEILINEFAAMGEANTGAHCCEKADLWTFCNTPGLNIIAIDATGDFGNFLLASAESSGLQQFLARGGFLALGVGSYKRGITPEEIVAQTEYIRKGLKLRGVNLSLDRTFITPTCGAGTQDPLVARDTFSATLIASRDLQRQHREEIISDCN